MNHDPTPYLGELEELTLLALLRQQHAASGNDVRADLAGAAERHVSPSTVYLTLMRLEEKGLCASWIGEPEPVPGGRARRRFRILPEGVEALRRSREIRSRMWRGFDALAERAGGEG
jgi:DNA-binding PadR family transcriptional regulator